jgi:cell division transport system permease protein
MNPAASSTALDAAQTSLESTPGVATVTFVDQQEAYEEYLRIYADRPELIAAVRPETLPPSFRLTLDDPAASDQVQANAETLDGVGQVVVPAAADPSGLC